MDQCNFCGKELEKNQKEFCSMECKKTYSQSSKILFPEPLFKHIFKMDNIKDKEKALYEFFDRHSYRYDLGKKKFRAEAIKKGYMDRDSKEFQVNPSDFLKSLKKPKKIKEKLIEEIEASDALDISKLKKEFKQKEYETLVMTRKKELPFLLKALFFCIAIFSIYFLSSIESQTTRVQLILVLVIISFIVSKISKIRVRKIIEKNRLTNITYLANKFNNEGKFTFFEILIFLAILFLATTSQWYLYMFAIYGPTIIILENLILFIKDSSQDTKEVLEKIVAYENRLKSNNYKIDDDSFFKGHHSYYDIKNV